MRDKTITNSESKLHIDTLARLNPRDLTTLQILSSYYTMAHYFGDPAYTNELRETLDAILELDPYNVGALDNYASLMYFKTLPSLDLSASPIFYSVGDERTFYHTHEDRLRDPQRTRDVLAEIDTAREYVTRARGREGRRRERADEHPAVGLGDDGRRSLEHHDHLPAGGGPRRRADAVSLHLFDRFLSMVEKV